MSLTYIIAEAGVNHNGDLKLAKSLVDVAVQAGVDAIKFQTFKAADLVVRNAPKAEYQKVTTDAVETQYDMLKRLELSTEEHVVLVEYCIEKGIEFLSTPFDEDSLRFLDKEIGVKRLKFSSADITNGPLLLAGARTGKEIILSTGMSTLAEIELALSVLAFGFIGGGMKPGMAKFHEAYASKEGQAKLREKVSLLHCTTEYPAPLNEVNLLAINTLESTFNLPVGYSDHTVGITVPIAAVARGAKIIEKHFTLDRTLSGPDHRASIEPQELIQMVKGIREVEQALGTDQKTVTRSERKNRLIARKSIVAATEILRGEIFTEANLTFKRPADGLSPYQLWELLGQHAQRDYQKDEIIK